METSETVKEIRSRTGLNRKEFCQKFGIPLRTMEEWETGRRIPPEYIPRMLAYYTRNIDTDNARNEIRNHYDIVEDAEGNKVVIINDLRFKSRRNIDWNTVEQCLKEYVGSCVQILETSDEIYIGKDFPDEYTHSKDTKSLKGANRHAKANASQIVEPMIKIAAGKTFAPNYEEKHVADAKYGWYRYDTRFAIPVYNDEGNLRQRYYICTNFPHRCIHVLQYLYTTMREICADIISLAQGF